MRFRPARRLLQSEPDIRCVNLQWSRLMYHVFRVQRQSNSRKIDIRVTNMARAAFEFGVHECGQETGENPSLGRQSKSVAFVPKVSESADPTALALSKWKPEKVGALKLPRSFSQQPCIH